MCWLYGTCILAWFLLDDSGFAAGYDYWDAVVVTYSWYYCRSVNKGRVSCVKQVHGVIYSSGFTYNLF